MWEPWSPQTKNAWKQNFEEQHEHSRSRIRELIASRIMYDGTLIIYKQQLRSNISALYERKNPSEREALLGDETKQKIEFNQMFEDIMSMSEEKTCSVNVADRVSNIYEDIGVQFNVKEKHLETTENLSTHQATKEKTEHIGQKIINLFSRKNCNRSNENDEMLQSVINKIENLLSTTRIYSDDTVIKARTITNDNIDQKRIDLWQLAHQCVYDMLVHRLSHIQTEWEQKNLIPGRLRADRAEFWNHYQRTIKGLKGIEMLTSDLKAIFLKHWRRTFCGDICTYIVNQRGDYLPWLTNSAIMMAYVNLQLLEWEKKDNVEMLIKKVAQPAEHYKDRVNELLCDEITQVQQSRWLMYRNHLCQIIDGACMAAVENRNQDCTVPETDSSGPGRNRCAEYLSYMQAQLRLMGEHAKALADDVGVIVANDSCDNEPEERWTAMSTTLKEILSSIIWRMNQQELINSTATSFSMTELEEMVKSIHDQFSNKLELEGAKPRCSEPCPLCRTPCSKQYLHGNKGDKLHDCEHQSQGLVGTIWIVRSPHIGCLIYQSCSNMVGQNCTFRISDGRDIPYRNFSKHYPDWKQPDPLTTYGQETRQYIFAKYQEQLAEYLNKKPCADVPPSFHGDPQTIEAMLRHRIHA